MYKPSFIDMESIGQTNTATYFQHAFSFFNDLFSGKERIEGVIMNVGDVTSPHILVYPLQAS